MQTELYVGIDVQVRRGLPYCILDESGVMIASGWIEGDGDRAQAQAMLDAICAAATVREFASGRGWEAGGGDGLGTIVLPGPAPQQHPCMQWGIR